jgi:phage shock protein PspC (stress-responsive transcriptional regulator)
MPLPDELEKLNALHERGALTAEEFALAKKRLLEGAAGESPRASAGTSEAKSALSRLRRSIDDSWIGGVCGGLGEHTGIPAWSWRILFVLTAFLHGLGLLMYVLMWIFVPRQEVSAVTIVPPAPRP